MLLEGERKSLKLIFERVRPHQIPDILEVLAEQTESITQPAITKILRKTAIQIKEFEVKK